MCDEPTSPTQRPPSVFTNREVKAEERKTGRNALIWVHSESHRGTGWVVLASWNIEMRDKSCPGGLLQRLDSKCLSLAHIRLAVCAGRMEDTWTCSGPISHSDPPLGLQAASPAQPLPALGSHGDLVVWSRPRHAPLSRVETWTWKGGCWGSRWSSPLWMTRQLVRRSWSHSSSQNPHLGAEITFDLWQESCVDVIRERTGSFLKTKSFLKKMESLNLALEANYRFLW